MFTGLVQAVGVVAVIEETPSGVSLFIDPFPTDFIPPEWVRPFEEGESICVSGCCLTLARTIARHGRGHALHAGATTPGSTPSGSHLPPPPSTAHTILGFDVIPESLSRTTLGGLRPGAHVNLERSATLQTFMGGHLVQGHVDGLGAVTHVRQDDQWRVRIQPSDASLMHYLVPKGSVAVDGVSLTVASLTADAFEVALIPTTLERTTLASLHAGSRVNLEADSIAKTVVHWLRHFVQASPRPLHPDLRLTPDSRP